MAKKLTEEQIERSMTFARSAMALAGHTTEDRDADQDIRKVLSGEMTYEEAVSRIAQRHRDDTS